MIQVLVVDDHPIVRRGTCDLLAEEPEFEIVGQGSNGQEAIDLVEKLRPDVLVIDVSMPVLDGVAATRELRAARPTLGILVLSAGGDDDQILQALQAGANGYVLKNAPDEILKEAVRLVSRGEAAVMQPEVTRALLLGVGPKRAAPAAEPEVEALTEREVEVLKEVCRDLGNKQIARALSISDRTVQQHLANIFGKMQVGSRTGAVLKGLRLGILKLEDCQV